jgi:tetratricopeptide (TPR) repeat protein
LTAAKELLPTNAKGHVLFTTRAQAVGGLASVTVDCFDDDTGAVFLLRRSKQVAMDFSHIGTSAPRVSDKDWQTATELVHELGGLALAIDQAGAYIEQTECGLEGYLSRYRTNAVVMLKKRGYVHSADHPEEVYKTFLLTLENVEKRQPLAREILCISAFLHPDGIPEEIFAYCNQLELDEALEALKDYSLIQRISTKRLFKVHHLVQVVTRDICHINKAAATKWVEKAILRVDEALPEGDVKYEDWQRYERLLNSSLACAKWIIDLSINNEAAARLLAQNATYLQDVKADYQQAEVFKEKSLAIYKILFGDDSIQVTKSSNDLARLLVILKKFERAKALFINSLKIKEKLLNENDPSIAYTLNNFAWLYDEQNRYAESKPLRKRSIKIMKNAHGKDSLEIATCLGNLGEWYRQQGYYAKAERLLLKDLEITKAKLGDNHPDFATTLNNLAGNYRDSGNYEAAKPLYQESIEILENTLTIDHPYTKQVKANYEKLLSLMHNSKTYCTA